MKKFYVYPDSIPYVHLGVYIEAEDEESAIKQAKEGKYFEGYQGHLFCSEIDPTILETTL